MPNATTRIESYAFYNCIKLKKITQGGLSELNYVVSIGKLAFYKCYSEPVLVHEGYTLKLPSITSIADEGFRNCGFLKGIECGNGLTKINPNAFQSCGQLLYAEFPSATSIGASAFAGDLNLEKVVTSELESIGSSAFYDGYKEDGSDPTRPYVELECPKIKDNCIIGTSAFEHSNIHGFITGKNVTLGERTCANCPKLGSAKVSAKVIPASCFNNTPALTECDLDGTVRIETYAFYRSSVIPNLDNILYIGSYAFSGNFDTGKVSIDKNCTVKASAFSRSNITSVFIAENSILEAGIFSSCSKLTVADMPFLKNIPANTFNNCSNLVTANFPRNTDTVIGAGAFSNCGFTTFDLGNLSNKTHTQISDGAFKNCSKLSEITTFSDTHVYKWDVLEKATTYYKNQSGNWVKSDENYELMDDAKGIYNAIYGTSSNSSDNIFSGTALRTASVYHNKKPTYQTDDTRITYEYSNFKPGDNIPASSIN